MSVMIQIRNVPAELHRKLKARAAMAGRSLSDYLLAEIRVGAEAPTLDELKARVASRSRSRTRGTYAGEVRAGRAGR